MTSNRRMAACCVDGPTLEVGAGSGIFKEFFPDVVASDLLPCGWRIANQPRNPLRLSSFVILGVVARMSRCATRSSYWFT